MGGCVHQHEGVKETNIAFIILIFTLLGIIVEFYRNCVCGYNDNDLHILLRMDLHEICFLSLLHLPFIRHKPPCLRKQNYPTRPQQLRGVSLNH